MEWPRGVGGWGRTVAIVAIAGFVIATAINFFAPLTILAKGVGPRAPGS